jgi:hypothetical protein
MAADAGKIVDGQGRTIMVVGRAQPVSTPEMDVQERRAVVMLLRTLEKKYPDVASPLDVTPMSAREIFACIVTRYGVLMY